MATIKELNSELEKITKELRVASLQAKELQTVLSSKNWGAESLGEMSKKLSLIQTEMSKLNSKKVTIESAIVNEEKLKDYNKLLKSIESAQATLSQRKTNLSVAMDEGKDFRVLAKQVDDAAAALKRFQSIKERRYDNSGNRVQYANPIGPEPLPETVTHVPGGAAKIASGNAPDEAAKAAAKAAAEAAKAELELKQVAGEYITAVRNAAAHAKGFDGKKSIGVQSTDKEGEFIFQDDTKKQYRIFADKMGRWGKTLKDMNNMAFAEDNPALTNYAMKQGFAPSDRMYSVNDSSGAYTSHRYQKIDDYGVRKEGRFRSDNFGGITTQPARKENQSFAQGITRDVGELMKWSIAMAAIYGPINAVSEAMTQLIENQAKLADVTIAVNDSVASTSTIFDDVYDSAQAAGEGVSGVIDAFGQAFQAAGRVTNEYQRYNTAVKLTNDALTLSKLSTLDQAGAIDVLTAALYQTADANAKPNEALEKGTALIDQWIRVSKIAAVSVETLATGVAVLGDSAETAGLNVEQLNALIATLSETSLSSGKETANIAKALIGNYQQDSAVKELGRLGIAVTDTTGKTRQFLDVMGEVAAMRKEGILGDQDFSRLTLALGGGGIRRQKDVQAFLENYDRMQQIAGSQGGASGEAEAALAKKLDTVETSTTRLTNAFTNLAQSLGTEGGLLDVFSTGIDFAAGLVEAFDKIASAVGKVGPLLLGLGVGSILMKGKGGAAGLQNMMMNNLGMGALSSGLLTGTMNPVNELLNIGMGQEARKYGGNNRFAPDTALGRATSIPSIAAIALPAIQNYAQGDTTEAAANIAGGIAGALAGGPIGAVLGAAIAESFVRTTMTYETQFSEFFAGTLPTSDGAAASWGGGQVAKTPEQMTEQMYKEIGKGSPEIGKFWAKMIKELSMPGVIASPDSVLGKRITSTVGGGYASEEAAALAMLKTVNPELAAQMESAFNATGSTVNSESAPNVLRQKQLQTRDSGMLGDMQRQEADSLLKQLIEGDIKASEYQTKMNNLSAFTTSATNAMSALVGESGKLPDVFKNTEDAYGDLLNIASSGNQELINQISQLIAGVDYYEQQLSTWTPGTSLTDQVTGETFVPGSKQDIVDRKDNLTTTLSNTISYGSQQAMLQKLKIPDIYGSSVSPTASASDIDIVTKKAMEAQDRRYSDLSQEQYDALKGSFEEFQVLVEEGGKIFLKTVGGGIDKEIFGQMFQEMQKNGDIQSADGGGLGWSVGSATQAQYQQAIAKEPAFRKMLESKGYESKVEDAIITTSDKQTMVAHGDQKVIAYLLEQILDTERKQLQGVWNLPDGAEFWVPLQSILDDYKTATEQGIESSVGLQDPTSTDPQFLKNMGEKDYVPGQTYWQPLESRKDEVANAINDAIYAKNMGEKDYIPGTYKSKKDVFDNGNGGAIGGGDSSGVTGLLSELLNAVRGLQLPVPNLFGGGGGFKGGDTLESRGPAQRSSETQGVSTKLDLKLTSTTQLIVDGRTLASIVKPYLAGDLLKTNESGGTVTRSYVI